MYIPKSFLVENENTLFDFIEHHSFGIIFSIHDRTPMASHLPILLDRHNRCLYGHFAKENDQLQNIANQEVLVIFHGPHHYISPSWYETNISVPTWNYVAVHAYGFIKLIEEKEELLRDLNEMVLKYEQPNSSYQLDETNEELVEGLMNGIVGFKINISKLQGKWKLSQNHKVERQQRVIKHLEEIANEDALEIARLMNKNIDQFGE